MFDDEPAVIENVVFITDTPKAVLVELSEGFEKWVPKSVIHDDSEIWGVEGEEEGLLKVASWWAKKEGLI